MPRKRDVKAWTDLRDQRRDELHEQREARSHSQVRRRHEVEQEITRLQAMPANQGRSSAIRRLKRSLGGK